MKDFYVQEIYLLNQEMNELEEKINKIKEYIIPLLDDVCVTCECFENENMCYACDYEHHIREVKNGNTRYNLAKNILQIIGE